MFTNDALDTIVERVYRQQGLNLTRMDLIRQAIRRYLERETTEVGWKEQGCDAPEPAMIVTKQENQTWI